MVNDKNITSTSSAMPLPGGPAPRAQSAIGKKTGTQSVSPKALSIGARPLKKSQAAPIVSDKSSIIARLQGDPALPAPLHAEAPPSMTTPDEVSFATSITEQSVSCDQKKVEGEKKCLAGAF